MIVDAEHAAREAERRMNGVEGPPCSPARLRLVPFADLQPSTDRAYLIKGLIPRPGLTVVWGPPKCGKSFWTFDALMHVALGWSYRGRRVVQGPVVYVAAEGDSGFNARAEAFRVRRMAESAVEAPPFYLVPARFSLVAEHGELVRVISDHLDGQQPVAVAIDTLNRTYDGSESDDRDMTAYIAAADAIREAFDCAVVIVHHCGLAGDRPRGHTSLTGAVDAQLAVRKGAVGAFTVTVELCKDGPEGEVISSRLEVVEVGVDIDGDSIKSCVIAEDASPAPRSKVKLTDRQSAAWQALVSRCREIEVDSLAFVEFDELMLNRGVIDDKAARARFTELRQQLRKAGLVNLKDRRVIAIWTSEDA